MGERKETARGLFRGSFTGCQDLRLILILIFLGVQLCWVSGCGVDVRDGIGPRVPVPNVEGSVLRNSQPANNLGIDLRAAENALDFDSTSSNADGVFTFCEVPSGLWELKMSGEESNDIDSIRLEFHFSDSTGLISLPPVDIHAFGAHALEPADSATASAPNPFNTLNFAWSHPERDLQWARVQLSDEDGDPVWYSAKEMVEAVAWNGLGNKGAYDGALISAGSFSWRVKFSFSDSVEARTEPRMLVLQ
jgi:hypothetical protein